MTILVKRMQMTVAQRLFLLMACSALGLFLVAGVGIYQTKRVYTAANFANENTVPALIALNKVGSGVAQIRTGIYRHVFIGTDATKMADIDSKLEEAESLARSGLKEYEPTIVDNEDRKRFDKVSKLYDEYVAGKSAVLASSRANKKDEANALIATLADKGIELDEAVAEYLDYNVGLGKAASADAGALQSSAIWQAVVISVMTLLVVLALGLFILRVLLKQLGGEPAYAVEVVNQIAAGDLTVNVETKFGDTSSMLAAVKNMVGKLSQIVGEVNNTATNLASASEEVSATAQSMSQATNEQAASVEETSASVEQMRDRKSVV